MNSIVPTLRTRDYETAKKFYVDGLGFRVDFEWRHAPGFPVFAQVSRAGMRLYLTEHEGDCDGPGLVYFYVQDVDAWQAEFLNRGVVAESPPIDQPWGNRELHLRDPDGNRLRVCSVIADAEEAG
jgi:catechol 2,3-dioxygenase-like lactoylglutathione lyase family enzyme